MIFDKTLRSVEQRNQHIHDSVDEVALNQSISKDIANRKLAEKTKTGHYLETIANYILESPNVASGRKIDNSFYPTEKYYWSKSSVAKNLQVNTDKLLNYADRVDEFHNSSQLRELFGIDNITQEEIRNVILLGLLNPNRRNDIDNELGEALSWLCEEILDSMSLQDKEFVSEFDGKVNVSKVAAKLGMSHQNVSKKLKKICKNAEKWLRI